MSISERSFPESLREHRRSRWVAQILESGLPRSDYVDAANMPGMCFRTRLLVPFFRLMLVMGILIMGHVFVEHFHFHRGATRDPFAFVEQFGRRVIA